MVKNIYEAKQKIFKSTKFFNFKMKFADRMVLGIKKTIGLNL